jgi:hypothetical protein
MDVIPNLYACVFESAPVALCVVDGNGRILLINPTCEPDATMLTQKHAEF